MSYLYGGASSSSHIWTNPIVGSHYLETLLEEKKMLAFFVHGLPICNRLLKEEIWRASSVIPDFGAMYLNHLVGNSRWNTLQLQGPPIYYGNATSANGSFLFTNKSLRVIVPIDIYPNVNFVGRLLGPRGNSLKRIQALTGCRIFIRGRGSMKDRDKEERLRGRVAHLNEPLHVLIQAQLPEYLVNRQLKHAQQIIEKLLIPVKGKDSYKRHQFQELAMLNSLSSSGSRAIAR